MNKIESEIEGLFIIEPRIFEDDRGYFFESFNDNVFREQNLNMLFVQDNESKSKKGVARGFHYQLAPYAQAKLVRVIKGSVQDVVVDMRPDSPTKGKHYSIILSEENKKQLLIPRGFAHAFLVLEDDTIFSYKCDNFYSQSSEGGFSLLDQTLGISWALPQSEFKLSEKDTALPLFADAKQF